MDVRTNKYPLMKVEWVDSCQPLPSWRHEGDYPTVEVCPCCTVGWLVGETKDALMLAQNVGCLGDEDVQASGFMRIVKRCVTKRTVS